MQNLLNHPVCLALVRTKWNTLGRYLYYGNLIFYILFLVFLTSYMVIAPNPATMSTSAERPRHYQHQGCQMVRTKF